MNRWHPMTGWRRARAEVAGAWRSLRYDLDRLIADRAAGPEVPHAMGDGFRRSPRRVLAVAAFGVLAVVGAVGCYVTVVRGFGPSLAQETAVAEPYPQVTAAPTTAAPGTHRSGAAPAKTAPVQKAPRHRAGPGPTTTKAQHDRPREARPRARRVIPRPSTPRPHKPAARPTRPPPKAQVTQPPPRSAEPAPSPSPSATPSAAETRPPTLRVPSSDVGQETPESPAPSPGWLVPLLSGHPGPFTRPGGGIPHPGGVPVRSKL